MTNETTPAPFPVMDVYCANCHECYHETLPTFDPQAPRSDDIKLKDFWAIECGWQPIPPQITALGGEFLCPSCGSPMARDNGTLWVVEPGQTPDFWTLTVEKPGTPVSDVTKGDLLDAELKLSAEERKAEEEAIERKRIRALSKAEKDDVILQMRDRERLTFREIAERIGTHYSYPGKRYRTIKHREQREREKAKKKAKD